MEIVGAVTTGIYLDHLQRKVAKKLAQERKKTLEGLEHLGEKTLKRASYEIFLRIGQIREAYSEEMNKTIDKIDPLVREKIEAINTTIDAFSGILNESVQTVSDGLLTFSNNWIFSSQVPQITSIYPTAVYGDEDVIVGFKGNFIATGKYRLLLEEHEMKPCTRLTNQLEFIIPKEAFSGVNQSKILKGKLIIPIARGFPFDSCQCLLGVKFALFPISLAAFPKIMGVVTIANGIHPQKETLELPWGASAIRSVQQRSWKVFLKTFNESSYELSPGKLECPFLKIKDFGDRVSIEAKTPRTEMLLIRKQEVSIEIVKPKPMPSPPNTPPILPISDFRRKLGVLPSDIQASSFQNFGRNCPQELKNYIYLYNEHINKPGTKKIRWAKAHKVVAINKSGKWRFYWVGPRCGASHEASGSFEGAFNGYKPKYLDQAHIILPSKL